MPPNATSPLLPVTGIPPPYAQYSTVPTQSPRSHKRTSWGKILLFIVAMLALAVLAFDIHARYPCDIRTPEQKMRDQWDLERTRRENAEQRQRDDEARGREKEREERHLERDRQEEENRRQQDAEGRERKKWQLEKDRQEEENRRRRDAERREKEKWQLEKDRQEEENRRRRDAERREREQWQYERDQEAYRREMEKRERERREELEKLKYRQSPMYWQPPTREKCVQYATRQYSSRLWDMPDRFDWKKACLYLPITINNQVVEATSRCENHGSKEGIVGYWLVNVDEPTCTPFWSEFTDDGCSGLGTGMHRYNASLQNLYPGDDWPSICHTTAAVIEGIHFANPTYCYDKDNWHGMWGTWEIEDSACA